MKVGQLMDIIYLDRNKEITQRHIRILSIKGGNMASQVSQHAYR